MRYGISGVLIQYITLCMVETLLILHSTDDWRFSNMKRLMVLLRDNGWYIYWCYSFLPAACRCCPIFNCRVGGFPFRVTKSNCCINAFYFPLKFFFSHNTLNSIRFSLQCLHVELVPQFFCRNNSFCNLHVLVGLCRGCLMITWGLMIRVVVRPLCGDWYVRIMTLHSNRRSPCTWAYRDPQPWPKLLVRWSECVLVCQPVWAILFSMCYFAALITKIG